MSHSKQRLRIDARPRLVLVLVGTAIALTPLTAICLPSTAPATQPSTATTMPATVPAVQARMAQVIADLDAQDFETRRVASLQLNSLDGDFLPFVVTAIAGDDVSPESRSRLSLALRYLRPRAARLKQERAFRTWARTAMLDAYRDGGHFNADRNTEVVRAVDLLLDLGADPLRAPPEARTGAMKAFDAAERKGCDDPLILTLRAAAEGLAHNGAGSVRMSDGWLLRQSPTKYGAAARLLASTYYLLGTNTADTQRGVPRLLLPVVMQQAGVPDGAADRLARWFYDVCVRDNDNWGAVEPFLAAYEKAAPRTASALCLNACRRIDRSYDSSIGGWGQAAAADLDAAHDLLTEAAKADPSSARPHLIMLKLLLVRNGSHAQVDECFTKALEADPDNFDACIQKLRYLRQDGDAGHEEMIAFGRECLHSENWRGRIPFILLQAHEWIADDSPDRAAYFEQDAVWNDLHNVFDGALVNFRDDARLRSAYVKVAAQCGRWDVAHQQLNILGDRADLKVFGGRENYDYLREKAERRTRHSTTEPAP